MASVTQFAQFLLNNDPQKNVGRLSLYHFLKNHDYLGSNFDENIIKEFYFHAFSQEYWRKNKQSLEKVVKECVVNFQKTSAILTAQPLDQGLPNYQIISLEKTEDQVSALKVYLSHQIKSLNTTQELSNIKALKDNRVLVLIKNPDQSLEVLVFAEHFSIVDGYLVPLSPVTHLKYNIEIELRSESSQKLEVSPFIIARWENKQGVFSGHMVRGYTFQKTGAFQSTQLHNVNDVFLNLKKLESEFLNLNSDPFYAETIKLLEKSIQYLESGDEHAVSFATQTLKKAQHTLKTVFSHDKLLALLVSNLEYSLIKTKLRSQKKNQWPKKQPQNENHL
ncbi:MAG: hypothetical protein HOO06_09440 [Bdellovibrionaceae bacterium]|jgi:hypothetical protein|nr:hypothetical protein [Pseudobdellovibrionaceae bacterium]